MAGAARFVHRGRIDTRSRFADPAGLSGLVDALWPHRGSESVEVAGIGMANRVAAAD